MGGGSAPRPDPNIGIAAMKSAEVGEDYLAWMTEQAEITNQWAEEDRARYKEVFEPIENQLIAEAADAKSPERISAKVNQATADARFAHASGQMQQQRRLDAMGVKPNSGRADDTMRRAETAEALSVAGAGNMARRTQESVADAKLQNAANLGRGFAVNPGTSIGISNGAMSSGVGAAMQGFGQQAQILGDQHSRAMDAYNSKQMGLGALYGALGNVAGAAFFSSKDAKTDKKEASGTLDAVREMPVESWKYKDGIEDGGQHVGPYAEDFQKATGLGDGKSIQVVDAIGITMGAVKELDAKVTQLAEAVGAKRMAA